MQIYEQTQELITHLRSVLDTPACDRKRCATHPEVPQDVSPYLVFRWPPLAEYRAKRKNATAS